MSARRIPHGVCLVGYALLGILTPLGYDAPWSMRCGVCPVAPWSRPRPWDRHVCTPFGTPPGDTPWARAGWGAATFQTHKQTMAPDHSGAIAKDLIAVAAAGAMEIDEVEVTGDATAADEFMTEEAEQVDPLQTSLGSQDLSAVPIMPMRPSAEEPFQFSGAASALVLEAKQALAAGIEERYCPRGSVGSMMNASGLQDHGHHGDTDEGSTCVAWSRHIPVVV